MKKRIFTFLLALVMAVSCMPIISVAAEEEVELLEMQVGESLTLNTISGSELIAAEENGNKFMQVKKMDYNGGEGFTVKINPVTVGNKTIKNYYVRFKLRATNEEYNNEACEERYIRLGTVSNVTAFNTHPTNKNHFSTEWKSSGFEKTTVVGAGGWTNSGGDPICLTLSNSTSAGEFSLFINAGSKVSADYLYAYANQAAHDADPDNMTRGRWRTDHDVTIPVEIDDIQIGYFTDDHAPVKATGNFNDAYTEEKGFVIYTTIDFEDGTLVGKDANGNVAASVSPHNDKGSKDVDGTIELGVQTEADYNRVLDATTDDSGVVSFDNPVAAGIYTLSGEFRLAYFQNSGRRLKIGSNTYGIFDSGVHSGTIMVTNQDDDVIASFEIGPWWTNSEITFAAREPIESLKFTLVENGITEGDNTDYENTVDIKGLTLTMAESFTKTVAVGGDVIDSLDMYSTASYSTVTDDEGNTFLHIGNRDYTLGADGVRITTTATLEKHQMYTITFRARQPLNSSDFVPISVMPLKGGSSLYRVYLDTASGEIKYALESNGSKIAAYALGHKDMGQDNAHCFYYWRSEQHSAHGNSIPSDGWFTYTLHFRPEETINNAQFAMFSTYINGLASAEYKAPNGKNRVNPIDIDDLIIYKGENVASGEEIYREDFENKDIATYQSTAAYSVRPGTNKLSFDNGAYDTIVDDSSAASMILSGFDALPAGKYQLSVDVRLGAYDGELPYDKNVASFKMKPYLINPKLDNPKATLTGGKSVQLGGEWTTVTYSFQIRDDRVLEQLVLSLDSYGEGYVADVSRLDFRNFEITPYSLEISTPPFNAALMLVLRRKQIEKGDGNLMRGAISEDKLGNWETNGQTLEVKTEGETTYLAASNIKNNYSGFTYTDDKVLQPGTYLFKFKVRTAVEGEDTQLRITFCGNESKIRCGNEWVEFETVIDITEETPISFRFRGGPLAFYRQDVDIAELQLFDLRDLAGGKPLIIGENLFPTGNFEDPTASYLWNGNPNLANGWPGITVEKNSEEGNTFVTAGNRSVNHQALDLDTGVIVEAGRTYNIRFRIRVNHGRNSGMRCSASAGGTWYKLQVEKNGADYSDSGYNVFSITNQWLDVSTTYVAETDGSLKIRFSGDTSAKSVQDLDIDDIEVYLMFVDN